MDGGPDIYFVTGENNVVTSEDERGNVQMCVFVYTHALIPEHE